MKALLLINYLCILDFTVVENVLKEREEDSCVISEISNLAIISSKLWKHCVYMHVCMYVRTYVRTYVCMCVCMYRHMYHMSVSKI